MKKNDMNKLIKRIHTRILPVAVCVLLLISVMAACGNEKSDENNSDESQNVVEADNSDKDTDDLETDGSEDNEPSSDSEDSSDEESSSEDSSNEDSSNKEASDTEDSAADSSSDSKDESVSQSTTKPSQTQSQTTTKPSQTTQSQTTTKPSQTTQSQTQNQTTQQTTTANTSEPVEGTAQNPYLAIPDFDDSSVTTVEIPAGKSVFYDISRVAGKILKINDADAYVVYAGKKYTAQNGVVTFEVTGDGLQSDALTFEIGNSGSSKKSFKIMFTSIEGTYDNPETLTTLGGSYVAYLEKGNDTGYNYLYTAEKTGTIVFYATKVSSSNSADAQFSITNNNTYANRTTEYDGVDDGQGHIKVEMKVTKGDVVRIVLFAVNPNNEWDYPEATVTWTAQYK